MVRKIGNSLLFLILTFLIIIAVNQINWVSHATIKSENEHIEAIKNNTDAIVCILKANKRKYKVGETPDIEVEIINKTDSTILMVGSLDDSDLRLRLPISEFLVKHQTFGDVGFPTSACLVLAPTRELDFKRLESGFGFNPHENNHGFFTPQNLEGYNFLVPGIFTLTYYYSTKKAEGLCMKTTNKPELSESEPFDSLWRQVPEIELKSNTITIEYNL